MYKKDNNFGPWLQTGRWTMLLLGVAWGSHRWQANHEVEEAFRAKEAIEKPIRDAKHAAEKVVQDRREWRLFFLGFDFFFREFFQ